MNLVHEHEHWTLFNIWNQKWTIRTYQIRVNLLFIENTICEQFQQTWSNWCVCKCECPASFHTSSRVVQNRMSVQANKMNAMIELVQCFAASIDKFRFGLFENKEAEKQ